MTFGATVVQEDESEESQDGFINPLSQSILSQKGTVAETDDE